jgi:hypothetical protein
MKQSASTSFIPRPLVRTNQWVIVLSVIASWATGLGWLLLVPLISGLGGLLFNFNPVMKFARLFLKKDPKQYIPEDRDQQKFNQLIATICLILGFIGFLFSWNVIFYIFTVMVALAAFVAICGFCVGCFILFQWKQYRFRHQS